MKYGLYNNQNSTIAEKLIDEAIKINPKEYGELTKINPKEYGELAKINPKEYGELAKINPVAEYNCERLYIK